MPPSTLQARIKAFEALGTGASKEVLDSVAIQSESAEPEHLLDRPHSPSAAAIPPIVPTTYSPSASPSLRHRTSLVDLKDWVIDDGPFRPSYTPTTTILTGYTSLQTIKPLPHERAPLISFEGAPPSISKVPPLPPRKLSFNAPRSVSAPAASPTLPAAPPSSKNNMLMPPEIDHPYPPTSRDLSPSDGTRRVQGHVPASSVSSFHSVSLSSDGGDDDSTTPAGIGALHMFPMEREWTETGTEDGESLDESFENVSAPSFFLPPIALPPRPQKPPAKLAPPVATKQQPPQPQPPKLPQRRGPQARGSMNSFTSQGSSPSSGSLNLPRTPSTNSSTVSLASTRRAAPPPPVAAAATGPPHPPPRSRPPSARTSVQSTATTASDRSSILSQGTTTSRTSTSSRASVSATAAASSMTGAKQQAQASRARYETLFVANVRAHAPKPQKPPPPPPPPPLTPIPKRQNAGWRGLSMDIDMAAGAYAASAQTASTSAPSSAPEPAPDAKLDGRVVRKIWLKSRLEAQRLRDIWNECDPDGTGSLDRDAFARGMARIDEELRRAQLLGRANSSAGWNAAGATRALQPVPSRPILR